MNRRPFLAASAALTLSLGGAIRPAAAALKAGDKAPDFTLDAALAGKAFRFSLRDALKQGPVVLYFFPAAFTSGCTLEAHLFAEATASRTTISRR
jgi:thioredoxin-dependent peroxiredoxin